jgi:hypothetical protein
MTQRASTRERWDVEWIALEAGIKPAIRLSAGDDASAMIARYERLGAAVVTAQGYLGTVGRTQTLIYVAFDRARALEVRDAEAPSFSFLARKQVESSRRTGMLLGYPDCCIEAFCSRSRVGLRGALRAHPDYVLARAAYVPQARTALNTLMRASGDQIISFEPCRFDCPKASALAARCLDALARVEASAPAKLLARLAHCVAIAPSGARAIVTLAADATPRIVGARALERLDGGPADRRQDAFMRKLAEGGAVSGGMADLGDRLPAIVLDFRSSTLSV